MTDAVLSPTPPSDYAALRAAIATALLRRRRSLMRYLRAPEVWIPGGFFVLIALFVFLGPTVFHLPGPNSGQIGAKYSLLPLGSPGHLLGTDVDGNDILSRLLHGGQASIEVGLAAPAIGFVIGSVLGTASGYVGGVVDSVVMRLMDIQLAFPGLVLALAIAYYLGPSELHVIYALGFLSIPGYARLTRAQALRLRDRDFVAASRAMGGSTAHVMRRHMSPNIVPMMLTFVCLQVGQAILAEAALSYLGAGIPFPQPSWGNMIKVGQDYLRVRPDFFLIPGAMIFLTVVCVNLLANGLRDVASSESS